jgi:G3E family GTPase
MYAIDSNNADQRIPVTLLTGFLGAGKTTLLNNLLPHPDMAGTAVLINEFGEVGIDHHLVDKVDETVLVLDSGCICCSVQGDLVKALKNLAQRCSRREIPPVHRVVIETTGLADPVPVVYTLMQERFVAARYRCDGVITAVDSTHALQQLDKHDEAVRQVVMADRLLITKCDLADEGTRIALGQRLDTLNSSASKVEVREGRTSPQMLFGCGIYTAAGKAPDVAAWLGQEQKLAMQSRALDTPSSWTKKSNSPHSPRSSARHDESVSSFVVKFPGQVWWHSFAVAMGRVLVAHGANILRVKGLMSVDGDPLPRVIHCVQNVAYPPLKLAKWPEQSPFDDHCGRLVFIVQNLPPDAVADIKASLALVDSGAFSDHISVPFCPPPTQCWLAHSAVSARSSIQLDGWNVQVKRMGSASRV